MHQPWPLQVSGGQPDAHRMFLRPGQAQLRGRDQCLVPGLGLVTWGPEYPNCSPGEAGGPEGRHGGVLCLGDQGHGGGGWWVTMTHFSAQTGGKTTTLGLTLASSTLGEESGAAVTLPLVWVTACVVQ